MKTRVSELEVINDLFRGRVTELEKSEKDARQAEEIRREEVQRLRKEVEELRQREETLKRKLDEPEGLAQDVMLNGVADAVEVEENWAKRRRMIQNGKEI